MFVYIPSRSRNDLIWHRQVSPDGFVCMCVCCACVCDDNSAAAESGITRLVMGLLGW